MIFNKKKYKTAIALTVAIGFLNPFQLGLAQQSSGNQELVKAVKAVSATIKASVLTRMAEDYYIPKGFFNTFTGNLLAFGPQPAVNSASGSSDTSLSTDYAFRNVLNNLQYFRNQFVLSSEPKSAAKGIVFPTYSFSDIYVSDNNKTLKSMLTLGLPWICKLKKQNACQNQWKKAKTLLRGGVFQNTLMLNQAKSLLFSQLVNSKSLSRSDYQSNAQRFIDSVMGNDNFKENIYGQMSKTITTWLSDVSTALSGGNSKRIRAVFATLVKWSTDKDFANYASSIQQLLASRSMISSFLFSMEELNMPTGSKPDSKGPSMNQRLTDMVTGQMTAENLAKIQNEGNNAVQKQILIELMKNNILLLQVHKDLVLNGGLLASQAISSSKTAVASLGSTQLQLASKIKEADKAIQDKKS